MYYTCTYFRTEGATEATLNHGLPQQYYFDSKQVEYNNKLCHPHLVCALCMHIFTNAGHDHHNIFVASHSSSTTSDQLTGLVLLKLQEAGSNNVGQYYLITTQNLGMQLMQVS